MTTEQIRERVQEGGARHGDVWEGYRYDANGDVWVQLESEQARATQAHDIYVATARMWEGHSTAHANMRWALRGYLDGPCETAWRELHRTSVVLIREVEGSTTGY